jgi:hypothetical protein
MTGPHSERFSNHQIRFNSINPFCLTRKLHVYRELGRFGIVGGNDHLVLSITVLGDISQHRNAQLVSHATIRVGHSLYERAAKVFHRGNAPQDETLGRIGADIDRNRLVLVGPEINALGSPLDPEVLVIGLFSPLFWRFFLCSPLFSPVAMGWYTGICR